MEKLRTIARVVSVHEACAFLLIPSWDMCEQIRVPIRTILDAVPEDHTVTPDEYYICWINLDARRPEEVDPERFELTPPLRTSIELTITPEALEQAGDHLRLIAPPDWALGYLHEPEIVITEFKPGELVVMLTQPVTATERLTVGWGMEPDQQKTLTAQHNSDWSGGVVCAASIPYARPAELTLRLSAEPCIEPVG